MKIILSGANGAMGRVVAEAADVVCGLDRETSADGPFPVYADVADIPEESLQAADAIVDFSHFSAFPKVMALAEKSALPLVVATTGLSEADEAALRTLGDKQPVFHSANMSLGINVLIQALETITAPLADFDIEIIEKHHNKKADAPSGTALLLADSINDTLEDKRVYNCARHGRSCRREKNEIGISAVRGGTIPGEHTVLFAGDDELIELRHTALSKKIFANGALNAAAWLTEQPAGFYTMRELLGA